MNSSGPSAWTIFWNAPVRAERLALMRILLGLSLLSQQIIELLPYLMEYYGPDGVAPAGLFDRVQLRYWYWSMLVFNTDDPTTVYIVFGLWVAAALLFTLGYHTRLANLALWFFTTCFLARNPLNCNAGDDVLQMGIFLLMLSPCGRALSIDAWQRRRRGLDVGPVFVPAWPVRLIQLQLCALYCTTGLVKLKGEGWLEGSWWDGTSVHYTFHYLTLNRYSPASFSMPLWVTMAMTYSTVWWETLFPLLVLWRRTRLFALVFGVLLHIGILATLAITWFSLNTLSFYAVWLPDEFWQRWRPLTTAPAPHESHPAAPPPN